MTPFSFIWILRPIPLVHETSAANPPVLTHRRVHLTFLPIQRAVLLGQTALHPARDPPAHPDHSHRGLQSLHRLADGVPVCVQRHRGFHDPDLITFSGIQFICFTPQCDSPSVDT